MKQPASQIFHVPSTPAPRTLAAMLRAWLPEKSWSQIERLLKNRHVLVNGNLCVDAGRRLRAAEVVKVLTQPLPPPPRENDVKVQYLDPHVVVVEKPAGITSNRHAEELHWHERRKQLQPTLDELLPHIVEKIEGRGKSAKPKPGKRPVKKLLPAIRPVHRLDRDTSGLMVFARTVNAERNLGLQFKAHTIHRSYLAVVPGEVEAQTIESVLVRDRGDGRRGSGTDTTAGKRAVTHIRPIEKLDGYTLLECRLETGRTHQIRIHLAELGHPLCGEKVYHIRRGGGARVDRSGAPRIALHAAELGFDHPLTGESLHFTMPLPADLASFIASLRG